MNVSVVPRAEGETTYVVDLLPSALLNVPEMGWGGSEEEVRLRVCEQTEQIDRYEFVAIETGRVVGCAVLAPDEDIHVGPCLTIMWNYIIPEYRGALGMRFHRLAIRLAKHLGLPVLAYTHRKGVGQYSITYRRLHGQKD
ncbi:GNAT family N-acethyltransferase [Pseudomonas phage MR6]|uniref:Putative GNAT family N-acetyltransferase n=1 Tax=Pseudomonas phage MR5 TaxID=2711172 RepID=A0A6M3TCU2_9CAUD|nr:putative GNAT family N-acetyltransferase [Pseudomonas phage MR5]QJD54863.1 GNAT family N-acethyltransferase [Pseudomonas phage MR6]QJD54923.1 putative GNAT family N-acetyltransferase [Pseudomonas phage MR7]QJD55343.1 putative GNAT family N-acetyltransferase [Pseudomonas phage MR18]